MLIIFHIVVGICLWLVLYWAGKNYKEHPFKWEFARTTQKALFEGPYDGTSRHYVEPVQLAVVTFLLSAVWEATIVFYLVKKGLEYLMKFIRERIMGSKGWLTTFFDPFTLDPDKTEKKET